MDASASPLACAIRAAGRRPRDVVHTLGVSWTALSKWQRREVIPRADHLLALARLLGRTPEDTLALITPAAEEISQ